MHNIYFKKNNKLKYALALTLLIFPNCLMASQTNTIYSATPSYEGTSIREKPTYNSFISRRVSVNENLIVEKLNDDWYKLKNEEGYIHKDNIILKEDVSQLVEKEDSDLIIVNGNQITTKTSLVILLFDGSTMRLNKNQTMTIKSKMDNVYLIEYNNIEAFFDINQSYVSTDNNESHLNSAISNTDKSKIIEYAMAQLGKPYVFGGNDLETGVDCSAFVQLVYKNFGYNLQRNSKMQFEKDGILIDKTNILPGDLIFYGYDNIVSHVAIYIGDGKIVHAATPQTGICTDNYIINKPIIGIKKIV